MNESLNPYRKWLGIPLEEHPAHHYRLLGVEVFEGDSEVIVNAADARITFLKTFGAAEDSEWSERLIAEVYAAQATLLDPAKKALYDGQLQRRLKSPAAAKPAGRPPLPVRSTASPVNISPRPKAGAASPTATPAAEKRRALHPTLIAGLAALLIVTGSLAALPWLLPRSDDATVPNPIATTAATSPTVNQAADGKKTTAAPGSSDTGRSPAAPKSNMVEAPHPDPAAMDPIDWLAAPPAAGPSTPIAAPDLPKRSADPLPPAAPAEAVYGPPPRTRSPATAGQPPLPDAAACARAEKSLKEVYGKRITDARSVEQKAALAADLWKQAIDTTDDPAARFVMMEWSCRLTSDAGQVHNALSAAERMHAYFGIDLLAIGDHGNEVVSVLASQLTEQLAATADDLPALRIVVVTVGPHKLRSISACRHFSGYGQASP